VVEQASNWEIKLVAERWLPTALHAIHGEHSETALRAFNQVVFCLLPRQSKRVYNLLYMEYGYESIPINTIFRGMNIHLPAILMFTRGTRF
jgi:hypothetical protein